MRLRQYRKSLLTVIVCFLSFALGFRGVNADEQKKIDKNSSALIYQIGNRIYRIPREFVVPVFGADMVGGNVQAISIKIIYPQMQPYGERYASCLKARTCRVYFISIHDNFPSSEEGVFAREEQLHPDRGAPGPFGFTKFAMESARARMNYYRKVVDGRPIIFPCIVDLTDPDDRETCQHISHTSSGVTISYYFDASALGEAVQVDNDLMRLVDGFAETE
jgi:hypothetical protein